MKIWLNSDAKSSGGRRFFARVEEIMVDKDGKPVYLPKAPSTVIEPAPVEAPVVEKAPARVEPITVVVEQAPLQIDSSVISILTDVVSKCDKIIDILATREQVAPAQVVVVAPAEEVAKEEVVEAPAEEVVEEPAQEVAEEVVVEAPAEEVVEEPAQEVAAEEVVEAPAEEVAATEYVEFGEEDPANLVAMLDVPAEPAEEAAPQEEAPVKAPAPRSRNFAEKMRDASEIIQDRYDELKNYALRFRKLKSRISRKFDSINQGRLQFVKLGLAGKTLKLYLNMDINTTDPKFHCKDMSDKKTYVTVPTMLRIKSGRAVRYAKILIDQCAEQNNMLERRKPFVVDAMALIEEALAAKEAPEAEDVDVDADVDTAADAE